MRTFLLTVVLFLSLSAVAMAQDVPSAEKRIAPDFKLEDINQNSYSLNSYRQKQPVLLFFWTTWCPFCQKELAALKDTYPVLTSDGVEVLTIDVGESVDTVNRRLKKVNPAFKVLLDEDSEVSSSFQVLGVPTFILVDKKGAIIFQDNFFPKDYKELIKKSDG